MIKKKGKLTMKVPFYQMPIYIWDEENELSTLDIAVYHYLARCGNQGAVAFPALTTIARKCKMSRSSAAEAINSLVKHGFLKKTTIPGIGCEYEILYNGEPVQQADGTRPAGGRVTRPAGGPKKELSFKKNYEEDLKEAASKTAACEQPFSYILNDEEQEQKKAAQDRTADTVTTAASLSNEKEKGNNKPKPELFQAIDHYKELFTAATGQEPHIKRGQDHKLLKDIITNRGIKEALELLDVYFKEADSFTRDKQGYSIGYFASNINRLITLKTKGSGKEEPQAWTGIREWLLEAQGPQEADQGPVYKTEAPDVKQAPAEAPEPAQEPAQKPATDEEVRQARALIRAKLQQGEPLKDLVEKQAVTV